MFKLTFLVPDWVDAVTYFTRRQQIVVLLQKYVLSTDLVIGGNDSPVIVDLVYLYYEMPDSPDPIRGTISF